MSEIKRYEPAKMVNPVTGEAMEEDENFGDYVKYVDHLVAMQQAKIDAVREIQLRLMQDRSNDVQVAAKLHCEYFIEQLKEQGE